MPTSNRRNFLKTTAGTALAAPFVSRISWGKTSPMQRVQHVAVAIGGKGWSDLSSISSHEAVTLVAGCDVDATRRADLKNKLNLDVPTFVDWREMFDSVEFDSVSVSTPDHNHAIAGLNALARGKHVYGQKPLAARVRECRAMATLAKETGLVTQMGNQLASSLTERMAVELLHAGAIGKIKEAHAFSFKDWGDNNPIPEGSDPVPDTLDWEHWIGAGKMRPFKKGIYHPGNWRRRQDYGTGCLGDMGCHIWNPVYRGLGLTAPISVVSESGVTNADCWATKELVRYVFPGNDMTEGTTIPVTWYSGAIQPPDELLAQIPENLRVGQGSIYVGSDGILLAPHGSRPFLFPQEDFQNFKYPKVAARNHYHEFVDCIIGKQKEAPISNFLYAGPATESVLLGSVASLFPNQKLEWDAANCRVSNFEPANERLDMAYREGWSIPAKAAPAKAGV